MTMQTLVAVFDTAAHADAAVSDLRSANVPEEAIMRHAKTGGISGAGTSSASAQEQGFWATLFGTEAENTTVYDRSIESGSTVVTVKAGSEQYDRISAILEQHNPIDLDERSAEYESETTTARTTSPVLNSRDAIAPANSGDTIQLAAESLLVGKRAVSGGTTRIRKYVVETPVEEQVNLHSEKVTIERRPVSDGRPLDNASFADKTIEMTETSEEAVVSKTARVTEEIGLRKEASDRVETIKDTVRREEAEVEKVAGETETTRASGISSATPLRPAERG